MTTKIINRLTTFILIVLVSCLASCEKNQENISEDEIRIGVVFSLTGDVAAYGQRSMKGVNVALYEINSSGGINGKKIRLIVEDAKSSAKDGVAAINKLIFQDKVKFIIGDVLSSTTLAMAPIAERNKILLLAPGASNPALTDAGDYIFRNWLSDNFDGKALAAYSFKKKGIRTVATLYQKTDYCLGLEDAFSKEFILLGGTVLSREAFETDATDFRTNIVKTQHNNPEGVFVSAESRQTGTILKQAFELNFRPNWFSNLTVDTPECAEIAGAARNGVVFSTPAFDVKDQDSPVVRKFVDNFTTKYSEKPEATSGHSYDALKILAFVMQKHGTKVESVKTGLYELKNFPGVTGSTTFDRNGDVLKNVFIKSISGNIPTLLEVFSSDGVNQ